MTSDFADLVIKKVTPGKTSKYISDDEEPQQETKTSQKSLIQDSQEPTFSTQLTFHIKHIKVSEVCKNFIKDSLPGKQFLKIQWKYRKFSGVIQSPEALDASHKLKLDFTVNYNLNVTEDFVKNQQSYPMKFKISAVTDDKEIPISTADFALGDFLTVANKRESVRVIFSNDQIEPKSTYIAYLDVWYKFSCNRRDLKEAYLAVQRHLTSRRSLSTIGSLFSEMSSIDHLNVTVSEVDQFADNLLLVLNRNKVLKTSQTEINASLEERVRWLRYEANWKQTLQENAILHGKDPTEVAWRQWREEDTGNVKLRTYDKLKPVDYDPKLAITVEKLYFLDGSAPLRNDAIRQVYVEYTFLGHEGPEMESPFSLPIGTMESPTVFNWTKKFGIDIEHNVGNCTKLTQMIRKNEIIKFIVISEPIQKVDRQILTCEEVGYAEVPLEEVIQLENNSDSYDYEILDFQNPLAVVGYITIKFDGILAMRKMALTLMAPKGYKLFM